jgi:hypothetical protein
VAEAPASVTKLALPAPTSPMATLGTFRRWALRPSRLCVLRLTSRSAPTTTPSLHKTPTAIVIPHYPTDELAGGRNNSMRTTITQAGLAPACTAHVHEDAADFQLVAAHGMVCKQTSQLEYSSCRGTWRANEE